MAATASFPKDQVMSWVRGPELRRLWRQALVWTKFGAFSDSEVRVCAGDGNAPIPCMHVCMHAIIRGL